MQTSDELFQQLADKAHAQIECTISSGSFERVIKTFEDFLSLPQEQKNPWYFRLDPDDRGSEVGYRLREQKLGDLDQREYFHVHHGSRKWLEDELAPLELKNFLSAALPVHKQAEDMM